MALAYTQRLSQTAWTSAGTVSLYTAKAGQVTIIRDILLCNQLNAVQFTQVSIRSGPQSYVVSQQQQPAGSVVHLDCRQELLPGEVLELTSAGANGTVLVTGYIFSA